MEKTVKGYEFRFATHVPYKVNDDDYIIVKENIHYTDNTIEPHIRIIKNFKRDFYVTKQAYRNHKDKKESEEISKLDKYTCTQSELNDKIIQVLDLYYLDNKSYRNISNSPYLYGSDVSVTSLIKRHYADRFKDIYSPYSVCMLDIETNVLKTDDIPIITIISAVMKGKMIVATTEDYIKENYSKNYSIKTVKDEILKRVDQYIKEYIEKYNIDIEIVIAKNEFEAIKEVFNRLHQWKPDFLSIWNINYDLPIIEKTIRKWHRNPEDIFSDPDVPKPLRYYDYREGPSRKMKSNGESMIIGPANRWHIVKSTSSFYFIDAMCVYKLARLGLPEKPSYSLDNILNDELGIRKLKFKEADEYTGLAWHVFMQSNFPLEYIVYNMFDVISMLELEEKTTDLSQVIGLACSHSDFDIFNSIPKRLTDKLYYYYLEHGYVMGTTGSKLRQDVDDETLALTGWIISLSPNRLIDNGLKCIKEDPTLNTNIRLYNGDNDISSAYPSNQVALNVSQQTTMTEVIDIPGIPKEIFTIQNMNLICGKVNAVDYCTTIFNFPTLQNLLKEF